MAITKDDIRKPLAEAEEKIKYTEKGKVVNQTAESRSKLSGETMTPLLIHLRDLENLLSRDKMKTLFGGMIISLVLTLSENTDEAALWIEEIHKHSIDTINRLEKNVKLGGKTWQK